MINESVINEIYKKFSKPQKKKEELRLDYFIPLLQANHTIGNDGFEIELKDVADYSPFRRFLIRNLTGVLEFDKLVAFVFPTHILFLGKEDNQLHVHIKPEKPKSMFSKIFGR